MTNYKKAHKKKQTEEEFPLPTPTQLIAKVTEIRGGNLFLTKTENDTESLTSLPTKYNKLLWVKKNNYLIIEPNTEKTNKIDSEIVHVLFREQIKHIKKCNKWPIVFADKGELENEKLDDDYNNSDDIFKNNNRMDYSSSDDEDSSCGEDFSFNSTKIIISSIDSVSNGKDFYSSIKRDSDKFFVDDEKRAILANGEPANYLSVTNSGFLVPSSLLAEGTYNQTVLGVGFVPTCRSHKTTGYITINETGMEILKGFTFPDSGYTIMPASVHSNSFVYPKLTVFQQSRLEVVSQGLNSNKSLIIDALLLTSSANKDQINDDWYPEGEALNSNEDNKINSIWAISCKFQSGIFQVSLYQSADEFYANSKNNALLVESEIFHSNSISKHFSTMPLSHLSTDDMLKIDWLDETALPNEWRNKDYVVSRASFQNYLMRAAAIYLGASVNPDFKETYIKQTEGLKTKQEFFIVFSTLEIIITPIILCLLSLLVFFSTLNKKFTLTATEKSLLKRDHFFFMSLDKVLEHFGDGKHIIELIDSNSISKNLTGKQIGSNESLMEEVKEYTK
ncbi:putative RNA-binding protein eif1ad [Clydaea vesicula]|uniref:RNA-binding protein eif1ad n=1 Tax=Clydaea vesicula TaxID=447962 RepID=A0AAD5UAU8_9FUNG|nr:putative RNA-binding protein eif1ad [Clydaea vesicula]